jgi:hypothetical protein
MERLLKTGQSGMVRMKPLQIMGKRGTQMGRDMLERFKIRKS